MSDPLEDLVGALSVDIEPPSRTSRKVLLELARIVAHSSERKNAPLATFVAGLYAGHVDLTQEDAVGRVLDVARGLFEDVDDPG